MKWKDLKLGIKFFISFGIIIIFLIGVVIWATTGIGGIVKNAEEVIDGNKLRTELEQKYVQHLKWAQEVNKLLTDESITKLSVQTDPHKCDFGMWYYGEGRKNAEKLAPELKELFDKIEEPHIHLHESAIKIDGVFHQADFKLGAKLRDIKSDHLIWAHNIKDAMITKKRSLSVQTDPNLCKYGKWVNSEEIVKLRNENPELDNLFSKIEEPHKQLHTSAIQIENLLKQGRIEAAFQYYNNNTSKYADQTLSLIDDVIQWNVENISGMNQANEIYNKETLEYLNEVGEIFDEIIEKSKDYILTDVVMISKAKLTRRVVILIGLIAVVFAIIVSFIIARGILKPVKRAVEFTKHVASGDLTTEMDIEQKDEIGMLAFSMQEMVEKLKSIVAEIQAGSDNIASASVQISSTSQQVSQGASEQASSAEEVSSSMEEMVSNIQQNTDNARQTEKIATEAADSIGEGSASTDISVNAMKKIADKITIINDIAFQTNILALNAAVEAARAGEHGKGFAVVAAEVRKLAERSKVAADEIVQLAASGVEISEMAGQQLTEIVPQIENTAKLIQEITAASLEQNSGAEQVNNAIQQLNQVTQQNAAASEEMATGAEELSSQAEQLKEIISFFKIDEKAYIGGKNRKSKIESEHKSLEKKENKGIKPEPIADKGFELKLDKVSDNDYEEF